MLLVYRPSNHPLYDPAVLHDALRRTLFISTFFALQRNTEHSDVALLQATKPSFAPYQPATYPRSLGTRYVRFTPAIRVLHEAECGTNMYGSRVDVLLAVV